MDLNSYWEVVPIDKKDLKWDATLIFNHNRNKVLEVGPSLTLLSTNAGAPVALLEGYPIGIFYGTFFAVDGSGENVKNSAGINQIEKGSAKFSNILYSEKRCKRITNRNYFEKSDR
jgi:hypothetical protein